MERGCSRLVQAVTVKRETLNRNCTIDSIYFGGQLKYRQTNTAIKNKFGSKRLKLNTGRVLTVDFWERVTV